MKKLGIVLFAVLAFGVTANAGDKGVCASVHLGGADINWSFDDETAPPNNDANLSLGAIQKCDGTVMGQFQDVWAGVGPVHGKVSCVVIDGNNAWVSGILTHSNTNDDFDYAGIGFFIKLQDNGKNRDQDTPDMASFLYGGDPAFYEFSCYGMYEVDLYPLNNGQLSIK